MLSAEDLLVIRATVGGIDMGEHGGMDEVALPVDPLPARDDLDAVGLSLVDESHDAAGLLGADQRTDQAALLLRPAQRYGVRELGATFHEPVVDTALNEDARPAHAGLAGMHEGTETRHRDGRVQVRVVENQDGGFPPSSRVTLFRLLSDDARTMSLPTSVEPVKATFSTSRCAVISATAVCP